MRENIHLFTNFLTLAPTREVPSVAWEQQLFTLTRFRDSSPDVQP